MLTPASQRTNQAAKTTVTTLLTLQHASMMKEEALAKDTKLSKAFEHDKDPETVMRAAAGGKGSGVSNKPYRYIENYSLKGVKVWICLVERRGRGRLHR